MDASNSRCDGTDQSACYKHTCRVEYAVASGVVNKCNLNGCIGGESVLEEKKCPAGEYLRGFNRAGELDCVPLAGQTCPDGQYMQGFYASGDLNCVPLHATGFVRNCPAGKRLKGITGEGGIICEGICNQGQLWDDNCKQCYGECPADQKWNNSTKTPACQCVNRCTIREKWNTKCSECDLCVGRQTYSNTTCPGTCTCSVTATTANCPDHQKWNDNTKTPACQCVDRCPSGQTWSITCNRCYSCIRHQTYNGSTCRCECSDTATTANCSATQRWDSPSCQCVGKCSSATPKWDGNNCVSCPSSTPRWSGSGCVACPSSQPRWTGSQCVACPSTQPIYNSSTNACITCYQSNSSTPKWNSSTKTCVSCPSTTPRWNWSACVACPSTAPKYNSSNNTCITCYSAFGSVKPKWNSSTRTCVSCPSSTPRWSGSVCVACPSTAPKYNSSNNTCITCYSAFGSVKPKWNSSTRTCVSCPSNKGWNLNIYWDDGRVGACRCVSPTPKWNSNTKRCEACPPAYPIWREGSLIGNLFTFPGCVDSELETQNLCLGLCQCRLL